MFEAGHFFEVVETFKVAVFPPELENGLLLLRTDTGQHRNLVRIGFVYIELASHRDQAVLTALRLSQSLPVWRADQHSGNEQARR